MFVKLEGYFNVTDFAKQYRSLIDGKTGVSRNHIQVLIKKEKEIPGSTGLDVLEVNGYNYVRYSTTSNRKQRIYTKLGARIKS